MNSINFLPISNINHYDKSEEFENNNKDYNTIIRISSNNPPNKDYFDYYKPITINSTMVSGNHTNFPLLLSIIDSDLYNHVKSGGNDIAFANDTNWLDHEIELYKEVGSGNYSQLVAWIRIPSLSESENTTIYMYYGNSTMSSRENPTGIWDANYKGVWHLSESSGSVTDSTSYGTSGSVSGNINRSATGQINNAYDFGLDKTPTYSQINFGDPSDEHFDMDIKSFTISFWMNINASTDDYQLPLYKGATGPTDIGYDFETDQDANYLWFRIADGLNSAQSSPLTIVHDIWIYVAGVVNRTSNRISIFKNGLQVGLGGNIASIGNLTNPTPLLVPNGNYRFDGVLDEIRLCDVARSVDWIKTEYNNQYDPESFISLSSEINIDVNPPTYSNLAESADPLELGETEVISINISDLSDLVPVKIEFEGFNYTMINTNGNTWEYDSWTPNAVGNYSYTIYMEDIFGNCNFTTDSIEVIDTSPPTYLNLIESSDPLELGQTEVIEIDVFDLSGISEVKIEFEGLNHSMSNIGVNTWQYNSWKPKDWIIYPYKIHIGDNSGNWNMTSNTITVQDTYAPPPPTLNNPPSGYISGNIVFDWLDGSDPSGIAYYILIIDNETDLFSTPGYVYKVNITNSGNESSYYELTETLPSGKYFYFLAQIDGAGHQSNYTRGSFTFNLNPDNNSLMIYIIIAVIVASTVGSISVITIVRRKSHKKLGPPKKRVPFKVILGHTTKLLPLEIPSDEILLQNVLIQKEQNQSYSEISPDDAHVGIDIYEIKALGEELFSEGAYLEAIKQFQNTKDLLLKQDRNEEAALFSDLIKGIEGLIEEREKRLEILEKVKIEGNSMEIFELYYEIIEISKKLRDLDTERFYQSELIQFFQSNKSSLINLENYRDILEKKADSLLNNNQFETAAQIYGKCERISEIFIQSGRDGEIAYIEKYRNRKAYCLEGFKEKNFQV